MVDAMRASYALPGIFSPVLVGDRWLVDGALVNPVPVSAARALGAEIVIAANLSSDVFAHGTHHLRPRRAGRTRRRRQTADAGRRRNAASASCSPPSAP